MNWKFAAIVGALVMVATPAGAQHQTATLTPLASASDLAFRIDVRPYDFGAAELPTLHSFAAGHYDGKWVLLAGRTNGMHGFDRFDPVNNFPVQSQNREAWVIDPRTRQVWRRSLADPSSGLGELVVNSLSPTNTQFHQSGDRLYITGGYGVLGPAPGGGNAFGTFDVLTAIDLPGMIDWVQGRAGAAADHIRQTSDPLVQVTGGAMFELGGRTQLVFGHNFDGTYTPQTNGAYTRQVRSFEIVDDGATLSIADVATTPPADEYRRRDLNVFPVVRPAAGGQLEEGLVALSGVFTIGNGAYTVPVEIDAAGAPTMDDPAAPATFKQGFNAYHSAKLGLYSEARGEMHEILFGGISLQQLDEASGQTVVDNLLPFVNDVTAVTIDAAGAFSQRHLGYFPELTDVGGRRLRFGANAEFFAADGVEAYPNGVIQLDRLSQPTTLGYIFGGIVTNGPHTRGVPGVTSSASNTVFEVVLIPIPEPRSLALAAGLAAIAGLFSRKPHDQADSFGRRVVGAGGGTRRRGGRA